MAEILVVDDDERAGRSFAKMIKSETGLDTAYTGDPAAAIELAKSNHLKVAVLDQRMPLKSGTDLFVELRAIEPELRGILFSGQASRPDLEDAIKNKFCEFLNKNEVARLSERVMSHYYDAVADMAKRSSQNATQLPDHRSGFSLRGPRVHFDLIATSATGEEGGGVVIEGDYKTFLRLDIGETKRESNTIRLESEVIIEKENLSKISSNAGLKIHLAAELKAAVEASQRDVYKRRASRAIEKVTEKTYTLQSDPSQAEPCVRARHLQASPVYRRMRLLIRSSCECCGNTSYESINALVPTGDFRTRQVDYLSDNTQRVVDTGYERAD